MANNQHEPSTISDVVVRARQHLGMVIPVYFPASTPREQQEAFLWATLAGSEGFVEPNHILLVVDGVEWVRPAVDAVYRRFVERAGGGFEVLWLDQNHGKGGAICIGFREMLRLPALDRLCIRDDDADHSTFDLPNALLLYDEIAAAEATDLIAINGRRVDARRVLGFERGEFEKLMNRITWAGLAFTLAREGRALNSQWFAAHGEPPDIESGYKLYSRRAAQLLVDGLEAAGTWNPEVPILRFGVEIVPVVECIIAGGVLGEFMRTAAEAPLLTTFGRGATLAQLFGAEARWLFHRLNMPAEPAAQILRNAMVRTPLLHARGGYELLEEFYRLALADLVPSAQLCLARPSRF